MTEKEIQSNKFTFPSGVTNGLLEISRDQFLELMSCD